MPVLPGGLTYSLPFTLTSLSARASSHSTGSQPSNPNIPDKLPTQDKLPTKGIRFSRQAIHGLAGLGALIVFLTLFVSVRYLVERYQKRRKEEAVRAGRVTVNAVP
ncbi:hypothetical protein CC1G_04163 [Coprinopsis cinerea okayama7|uniref:Uncharacterized protein n=1 Tax=Coprinopsis cinerea (strain Okayama-7 / 130 / ATCC MYA-4618 / FGSC 9003) TaxID=240176 RepID=A8NW77_COPC7|nr:hypothetical protein CC1G_04163 [Coprinopsis cinerea okayama7\|eukprot:XP_001836850.1 hypothetical protein CC1G_04163 [Coprinopsis cinerea okayama7\